VRYLLAHDVGTTGDKATLFSDDGELVASETTEYQTYYLGGNSVEQDPKEWWDSVCRSTKRLLQNIDPNDIAAISFSGQMMGCVPVDEHGNSIRRALIYADQRATDQADRLIERVGWERMYRITGHRASASYSIARLMWLQEKEPETYRKTHRMLLAKDFIIAKLTGEMITDYSDASGTNAFDLDSLSWSEEIIEASGVDRGKFPPAVSSTEVVGKVTKEAARQTGLVEGIPVVAGAGDGGCATIGAGSVELGWPYNYMGSSAWISVTSEKPVYDPEMRTFNWAHPIKGWYQPTGTMQTAGSSFSWLQQQVCKLETADAQKRQETPYQLMNDAAEGSPPGANGVVFLPYLMGERSPWWNPDARGGFLGVGMDTTRADLIRAVIEGVALNLGFSFDAVGAAGAEAGMTLIGGGARGRIWRQILSNVYGMPLRIPRYLEEATSLGAAVIGGVGVGIFSDFSVARKINSIDHSIEPNRELTEFYEKRRQLLADHYRAIEPLFEKRRAYASP
jgi:xylulokinase